MTANRVALIDWDEAHVDVPDLDLVLRLIEPDGLAQFRQMRSEQS